MKAVSKPAAKEKPSSSHSSQDLFLIILQISSKKIYLEILRLCLKFFVLDLTCLVISFNALECLCGCLCAFLIKRKSSTRNKAPSSCFTPSKVATVCVSRGLCVNHRITELLSGNAGQRGSTDSAGGISNAALLAGVVLKVKEKASRFAALCVCLFVLHLQSGLDRGKTLVGCKLLVFTMIRAEATSKCVCECVNLKTETW